MRTQEFVTDVMLNDIMTAKQKAEELIGKFTKLEIEIGGQHDGYLRMKIHEAKDCALILVDEIIATQPRYPSDVDWDDVGATHQYFYEAQREEADAFWLSVKSELNAI
jgi:hypothetical protein